MYQRIVIVGGGHGGFHAVASLRSLGFDGHITLISDEPHLPYHRPPLSKGGLADENSTPQVFKDSNYFAQQAIELRLETSVTSIDRAARVVVASSGETFGYDRLILALGAENRVLSLPGSSFPNVVSIRRYDDVGRARSWLDRSARIAVVGGGFIGLELASAVRKQGKKVIVLEALDRLLSRSVRPELSEYLLGLHRRHEVDIRLGACVRCITGASLAEEIELTDGQHIPIDMVFVGVGIVPNDKLAALAGLEVGDGILVNADMRSSDYNIYAIGDCARFPSESGRMIRVESVQNATDQARVAAQSIMGVSAGYRPVHWFWSDQFGRKLQIAGLAGDADRIEVDGDPLSEKFTVFTFKGNRLLTAESIGRPADHVRARQKLAAQRSDVTPLADTQTA